MELEQQELLMLDYLDSKIIGLLKKVFFELFIFIFFIIIILT